MPSEPLSAELFLILWEIGVPGVLWRGIELHRAGPLLRRQDTSVKIQSAP